MKQLHFRFLFVVIVLFSFSYNLFAQAGPGGVGNVDGSDGQPRTVLWIDASSLGLTNGAAVETWTDKSGNGYDVIQSTLANRPQYVLSHASINNQPLVEFNGTNQFMWLPTELTTNENGIVGDDFACIMVAGRSTTSTEWFMGGNGNGPSGGNLHLGWRDGNTFAFGFWGNDVDGDPSPTPAANTLQITHMDLNRTVNPARHLFMNGSLVNTRNSNSTLSGWQSPTLGRRSGSVYGDLLIAEMIFYKGTLTNVQRVIIDNYLAEKYNLSISNDMYSNSAFQTDLRGVGQINGDLLSVNSSLGFYIREDGSVENGDFIMFGHNGSANTESTSDLPAGVEERWSKEWYVDKTGNLDAKIIFDLPEGISGFYPSEISNYTLLYRAGTTGNYTEVTATVAYGDNDQVEFSVLNANLSDGYYTLGTKSAADSPVIGKEGVVWYTLASGDWTDSDIWTLDPSGALPNNPGGAYPNLLSDKVVVKNGKTVTVNQNNLNCKSLTVEGRLDIGTTTGHSFDEIKGNGRIILAGDNFPSGDASHFISKGLGEGTVVFEGADYEINTALEFYDVEVALNASANKVTFLKDFDVNGNLTVKTGGIQINNNSSTTILTFTIDGDIVVQANGSLTVGSGNTKGSYSIPGSMPAVGQYHNIFHQLIVGGSFTNHGTVRLTNQNAPVYNQFTSTGAATLRFTGSADETFYCYNTTDLYNLVIEKGTDRTYVLELYSDNDAYFRLFGPNNYGRSGSSPFTNANPEVRKALWIYKGTLKLTGSVYIPTLSEGAAGGGNGDYAIGFDAKMWIAGSSVKVHTSATNANDIPGFTSSDTHTAVGVSSSGSHSALSLYGEFEIDNGYFDTDNSYGFVFWDSANPTAKINGGTLNVTKLYQVGSGTATYIQTGGYLTKNGGDHFDLSNAESVFQMSGGTIEVQNGNCLIGSKEGNYNVTGGTIKIKQNGGSTPILNTTVPLYNLEVESLNDIAGLTLDLQSELTVLNDLSLITPDVTGNTVDGFLIFLHNGNDVSIGRNFRIERGARYEWDFNSGNSWPGGWTQNTTTFNGTEDGTLYFTWHDDPTKGQEQNFWNLVLNKPSGKKLTLLSNTAVKTMTGVNNRLIKTHGELRVESGTFDQGEHSIRAYGNIVNKDVLTVYEHGVTGNEANIKLRPGNYSIETTDNAEFGLVKCNPGNGSVLSFTSDVYIKRLNYHNGRLDLNANNLKLDYLYNNASDDTFVAGNGSVQQMFITDGNSSDGGLSLKVYENRRYTFPIGVSGKYTPVEVTVSGFVDEGYLTINPVDGELKTTNLNGNDLLSYYWRVNHEGFTSLPNVIYNLTYDEDDVINGGGGNNADNNYYPGRVLGENPYTRSYINDRGRVDDSNNIITYDNGSGSGLQLVSANYTAGRNNRFNGTVAQFHSNGSYVNWNSRSTWVENQVPTEGSVVHIRNGNRIWGNSIPDSPAEVIFEHDYIANPVATQENVARLQFNTAGTFNLGKVSGTGMISLRNSVNPTVNGDWGEFADNPDAIVMYWNGNTTLTNIMQPAPSLMIEGSNVTIDQDIVLNADLILTGNTNLTLNQNVHVKRNLYVGAWTGGNLIFPGSNPAITVTVDGDIDFTYINESGDRDIQVADSGTPVTHKLIVKGDINQGSNNNFSIDLYNGIGRPNVDLEIQGESNNNYSRTSTSVLELYRIIMNKGTVADNTFTFSNSFNLNGATAGVGIDKAIELQNGTLVLDDSAIDINLTTGDDNFSITSTTALEVKQGTVKASGNSGINLDGLLKVSGGTVDMSGGNNPIIYSASGNAQINVSSGTLTVGSQIRRSTSTDDGSLKYYQSGGSVVVGETSAPVGSRGVFEIRGAGSHFEHTGGTLQIANGQTSATIASVYLTPETYNIADGTNLTFDPVLTSGINEIGIYSQIPLKNVTLANDALLNVKLWTVPLNIEQNLLIDANSTFNANGQDLNIGGNFTLNSSGSFTHGNNKTTFTGNIDQDINGTPTFYDLEKNGTSELEINNEINVTNQLFFNAGTFADNGNNLNVQGYAHFAGTHNYGGSGKGLVLNGSAKQELSGGGTLGMLTINNPSGIDVPLGNEFTITQKLRLESGVFNIDKNLLVLNENCIVEHGTEDFSETNMIQNNISFTDNGVRKIFPQVTSGAYSFVYPMGSAGKYTPVSVNLTANANNTGSLTVKPANEYHPSVTDPNNVLNYHWELKAIRLTGFSGEIRMKFDPDDAKVTGGNSIDDYITARLLADGTGDWNKFSGAGVIDNTTKELVFDFAVTDDSGISGAYTAGIDAAIPDQVPGYITISNGDWTNNAIWDTYPSAGGTVPAGGPRGSIVYIAHEVDVPNNFLSVYKTNINPTGTLSLGSTFGHRLGEVKGEGLLKMEDRGSLPAGVYDNFFSLSGGTLEFAGTTNYDFLSDINQLNNLVLSGTGDRRFPNLDLTILGDLTIDGANAINEHDRILYTKGDIDFKAGTYDAGTGASNVVLNGTALQYIKGATEFNGTNDFYNLTINNAAGVEIETGVEISNVLALTNGIVFNINDKSFTVDNASNSSVTGGGASSYVQGPLTKLVNNGDSFSFPIGDADRLGDVIISNTNTSGADYWIAEYFNNNPANEGKNPSSMAGDVKFVSHNEYWRIKGAVSAEAEVTLRWDNLSGVTPDDDFRVVEWRSTSNWNEVAIATPSGNNSAGTVKTASRISYNEFAADGNFFTFGSVLIPAFTWQGTGPDGNWFNTANWVDGVVPSAGTDITLNTAGHAPFIPDQAIVAQVNNLTINHNLGLTMQPGSQLTVNGVLNTNDRLFVENTNAKPASLITNGTVNGTVSVKWTYDNLRWWFIGHAISNAAMSSYEALRPANDYAMYDYQNGGSYYKVSDNAGTYNLASQNKLQGYLFKVKDTGAEVTQVGTLNDDNEYSRVLLDEWQIIANPYASYYKLPKDNRAGSDFEHTTGTVYVTVSTRNSDKTFETFNTISGLASPETFTNGIIAPSQAFYLKTEPGHEGESVFMRKGNRIHDVNKVSLKSTKNKENDVLRVKLNNGTLVDEAVIALREDGQMAFTRMDSEQRFMSGNDYSYIYSMIDDNKAVINVVPADMKDRAVKLGVKTKAGEHTIHIEGFNTLSEDYKIELEDMIKGSIVQLDANSSYTYTAEEEESNDRFILHFSKTDVSTGIGDGTEETEEQARVYVQNKSTLVVNCDWMGVKQVMLYTLDGRLVDTIEFKADTFTKDLNLKSGIYVVKLVGESKQFEQKVYVN
jgi:hypothetical protein